ncbi:leucine-rich repeat receptor-like serine/threonine-protein kinase BAM1 [Eutrema salsugineum]|uniref:leucine-rich repeat receptor-like serine/threonine-protein kinase BAM1 n=1 Tax=Eutrema salsugineum TaxID=72664 RepID=UPI000CED3B7B|nr:leucine-rich repeat receptor-like serine/threonine-protein kinase BAM1 [Eutrema salsugineum]
MKTSPSWEVRPYWVSLHGDVIQNHHQFRTVFSDPDPKPLRPSLKTSSLWNGEELSWMTKTSFCTWTGVTCDISRRHVTSLDLSGLILSGVLSPDISGPIPPEISKLFGLRHLNLSNNVFNGSFPDEISSGLVNLRVLDVYNNNLTGDLPLSVTNLTQLRHLHLGGNYFSSQIPSSYGSWPVIEYLRFSSQIWPPSHASHYVLISGASREL